jgi:hypothetical protein
MTTRLASPIIDGVTDLRYDDPPKRRQPIVNRLHLMTLEPEERWGKSVRVAEYTSSTVASVTADRLKKMAAKPAGRWEFESGRLPEGEEGYGVWARYLGPDE